MINVTQPPDPWQRTTTEHGLAADEVISALQKSIRRGLTENALLLGWEMYVTSAEMEAMLWSRLGVISVEDVGLGNPTAPILVETLYRMHERHARPQHDRFLFAAHAIRVMASGLKDRTTDDMANWAKHSIALGERLPEIPDFALDMHTRRGAQMGRDYRWFLEEASKVAPEIANRDETYRRWLFEALAAGKLG
ncbi:MAG TPA: AAA family ATPase [Devosia sp.]|nr:AAA family ATPase [Devosia sp.]